MTAEVILHVYDVTNSSSQKTNSTILQVNRIFRDRIRFGGIFHTAVQVYGDEEWSFGFCESGTGVFCCPSRKNPIHAYRESINLGKTSLSVSKVNQMLRELSRDWPGHSYHLLSKNCNHFCCVFLERLGTQKLPGWVNRFAHAGDAAMEIAGNAAGRLRQVKTEIVSAGKGAYKFLAGVAANKFAIAPESTGNTAGRSSPRFSKRTQLKNLILNDDKLTSTGPGNHNKDAAQHQQLNKDAK